ncbi:hypothetical protein PIROE2DRAFT_7405 [Piromyces sp. E2]|nr:hypothetical protein PIROE2DRAFT_7405 [Piromyces sp. E2]|eukprot:OUM65564.1 hypothetical protein PIROE2DRAFT_7405 [Piromyces sp. E2]
MSSEKSDSSFFPKSNAFKSFGKEEFLARRKFFLQKLENEGGIPKPKSLINNSSSTKKKSSNEKIKTTYKKPITTTSTDTTSSATTSPATTASNIKITKSPIVEKEKTILPDHEWSISSAKSESLKKIIDMAGKKETNTVGKSVFNARQKFFADSQLSSVDQLMPRPATPPGYCYYERCPSPSIEPRRNSYSLYTSSSPALSSSSILSSSPTPVNAPSPKPATYSLPWEHGNTKKKNTVQPKPQTPTNVIESLEQCPLVSEETLPDPVTFSKEALPKDNPISINIEKVEAVKPMVAKILESLPEPIKFTTQTISIDEPSTVKIIKVEEIKPSLPKHIFIEEKLPEPVIFTKMSLPNDQPIELMTYVIEMPKMNIPKLIHILPEPVSITKQALPQDEPLEIETVNVAAEEKKIPEKIYISDKYDDVNNELKTDIEKTINISSLALESNIEEKKGSKRSSDGSLNNYYSSETQPLIDIDSDVSENVNEKQPLLDLNNETINVITENKPLIDFDEKPLIDFSTENTNNNITENTLISFDDDYDNEIKNKKNSIGSISELLNSNGTLSLDDPLPRKSIPTYPSEDNTVNDLIEFSDSDNLSDKVKNWYTVVDNAISNEENNN